MILSMFKKLARDEAYKWLFNFFLWVNKNVLQDECYDYVFDCCNG